MQCFAPPEPAGGGESRKKVPRPGGGPATGVAQEAEELLICDCW